MGEVMLTKTKLGLVLSTQMLEWDLRVGSAM